MVDTGSLEGENKTIAAMVVPGDRAILDIGCGTGRLGMRLKAAREDRIVWGMERDPRAAQEASHRPDRVIVGDVESFPVLHLPDNAFDVMVCGDVLEHLRDPWAFVERLKPHLAPGGRLLCYVPNIGHHSAIREPPGGGFWPTREDCCIIVS